MKKTTTTIKCGARIFAFALAVAFTNFGCEPASLKKTDASASKSASENSAAPPSSAEENAASLEADLQTMRNADFAFVYVFRRKDGAALDGDDKKYLRANSPAATNRFILSEGSRAVIAGSSYRFERVNLDKLQERFLMENFSKPESENANTEAQNAPKNSNR